MNSHSLSKFVLFFSLLCFPYTTTAFNMQLESPKYHAFGFSFTLEENIFYVSRKGESHVDGSGEIILSKSSDEGKTWTHRVIYNSEYDDRNVSGGVTKAGRIIIFFSRYDSTMPKWQQFIDIKTIISDDGGSSWNDAGSVYANENTRFSPYGPLVELPSGKLLATFYEHEESHLWRLFTKFSEDGGETWGGEVTIYSSNIDYTGEASAIYIDGAVDSQSRLILITRNNSGKLLQFISSNGGKAWSFSGEIPFSGAEGLDHSPWLIKSDNNEIILAYADRKNLSIKTSRADADKAFDDVNAWKITNNIYYSEIVNYPERRYFDFGYPSLINFNNTLMAFIYDVDNRSDKSVKIIPITFYKLVNSGSNEYKENALWRTSRLRGFNAGETRYTSKSDGQAQWSGFLSEGQYEVDFFKIPYAKSNGSASIVVESEYINNEIPINFTSGVKGWQSLGEYTVSSNNSLSVSLKSTGGVIRADTTAFTKKERDIFIVDNDSEGYIETGSWENSSLRGYLRSKTRYSRDNLATAEWRKTVPSGNYRIDLYRVDSNKLPMSATVEIKHANGASIVQLDQTEEVSSSWVSLGSYCFSDAEQASIRISNNDTEVLRADAVKFTNISDNEFILDNDDRYYSESGAWRESGLVGYLGGSTRFSRGKTAFAQWRKVFDDGVYEVKLSNVVSSSQSELYKVEIGHANGVTEIVIDSKEEVGEWINLGSYSISRDMTTTITLFNVNSEILRTDAVKFQKQGCTT